MLFRSLTVLQSFHFKRKPLEHTSVNINHAFLCTIQAVVNFNAQWLNLGLPVCYIVIVIHSHLMSRVEAAYETNIMLAFIICVVLIRITMDYDASREFRATSKIKHADPSNLMKISRLRFILSFSYPVNRSEPSKSSFLHTQSQTMNYD